MSRIAVAAGVLTLFLIITWPVSSEAHKLSVFAWVEGSTVLVEARLPKGKRPKQGVIRVVDGNDRLLHKLKLLPDGTASFPLQDWQTGYRIIVDIGSGHKAFWILTPHDIRQQMGD